MPKAFAILLSGTVACAAARAEQIRSVGINVDGETDLARVADLLGLKKGDEFSLAVFDRGLARIADTGLYRSVEGRFVPETGQLEAHLSLVTRLGSVEARLSGAQSEELAELLRFDVIDASGLSVGDPVHLDTLSLVRERVLTRLHERGYPEARVVLALEQVGEGAGRTLVVSVGTGRRESIVRLDLKGFTANDAKELLDSLRQDESEFGRELSRLKLEVKANGWEGLSLPFDRIAVKNAMNRWKKSQSERGYYDFQIQYRVIPAASGYAAEFELQRGHKYRIEFTGNVAFWENDLRSMVSERSEKYGVVFNREESERLLLRRYLAQGFREAAVETHVVDEGEHREVTFAINEGQQNFLGDVIFEGAAAEYLPLLEAAKADWLSYLRTPFHHIYLDERLLRQQSTELLRMIRSRGFLQARLLELRFVPQPDSRRFVNLVVPIQSGNRFFVGDIAVTGNVALSDEELEDLLTLRAGDPINPDRVAELNQALLEAHREEGFINTRMEEDEARVFKIQDNGRDVDVELSLEPGPKVFVGKTLIEGLQNTKDQVVLRELDSDTLQQGGTWTPSRRRLLEERLLGLGIFSNVNVEPVFGRVLKEGDSDARMIEHQEKDLRIKVQEAAGGSIEVGPGFRSDLGLLAFAELNYRNLGGWNRGIGLRTQLSRKLQNYGFLEQRHSFTYFEPFLANDRLKFRFSARFEKKDNRVFTNDTQTSGYSKQEISLGLGLERDIVRHLRWVHNLYTLSVPTEFDVISRPIGSKTYKIGSMGTGFVFDNRDNLFSPTRGVQLYTTAEFALPAIGSSSDVQFVVWRNNLRHYLTLMPEFTLAFSWSYNRLWGLNGTPIPISERFSLGGRNSLRSLKLGALNSEASGVTRQQAGELKVEYRQRLIEDLGIAVFFDMGILDSFEFGNSGLRKGAGFGFRYKTPVGPVVLDFAYNLDAQNGEDITQVFLSIGSF